MVYLFKHETLYNMDAKKSLVDKLNEVILGKELGNNNEVILKTFEKASSDYESMIKDGKTQKRGYNLMSINVTPCCFKTNLSR